jgi:pimeloyl-ACP methyl ester carboxylesterase
MSGRIAMLVGLLAACGEAGRSSADAQPPVPDGAIAAPDATSTSTVPSDPIAYTKDQPLQVGDDWVFVPDAYDDTHHTPIELLVWLHGCGGYSSGDIWMVSPGGGQRWISLAVGGEEGSCWDVDQDPARVLASIDSLETHFNIARAHVVIGGYSSGGDLTYRTAFYHTDRFAGALVENSSPFRDTGSSMSASLAAATWKLDIVHLAHLQDDTYPIAGVRTETDAVIAAGFPLQRIEVDGGHWDDAGATENGHPVPGTAADLQTYLLPKLDAGWTAP